MTVLVVTVSAGRAVTIRMAAVPCSRCDWVAAAHGWFVTRAWLSSGDTWEANVCSVRAQYCSSPGDGRDKPCPQRVKHLGPW